MIISPEQLAVAMGTSFLILVVIISLAQLIHWYGRIRAKGQPPDFVPRKHFILLQVLLDENGHASLSQFQFLMWTLLISFLYITLWSLQLREGLTGAPPPIPADVLALMGISVAVPIASAGISEYKRLKIRLPGEVYEEPEYASMLEENGRPSLLRVQMFLWTLAAIAIYLWLFMNTVLPPAPEVAAGAVANAASAAGIANSDLPGLPSIDTTLLFLMGLSQAGYLGSKAYSGTVRKEEETVTKAGAMAVAPESPTGTAMPAEANGPSIREIIPRECQPKELVTLLGSGFGAQSDTLTIGQKIVSGADIRFWNDTRIEFLMPESIPAGKHTLLIVTGGLSASTMISVGYPPWIHGGIDKIDADIISEIWIDDPTNKSYRVPPIGYFITGKRYYFFFEFAVPPGTSSWGRTEFQARFYVEGNLIGDPKSFLPGYMNGRNYGVFDHVFNAAGTYTVEIRGATTKTMKAEVRRPAGEKEEE